VTQIIEAATIVADLNYRYLQQRGTTPVTAAMTDTQTTVIDPFAESPERVIYRKKT
jgi:hypothetical protein